MSALRGQLGCPERIALMLAANLALMLFCFWMAGLYRFHPFFLIMALVPYFLFDAKEKTAIRFSVCVALASYLFVRILGYGIFSEYAIPADPRLREVMSWLLPPVHFVLMVIAAAYLFWQGQKSQARSRLIESVLDERERANSALLEAFPDVLYRVSDEGRFMDYRCQDESDLFVPAGHIVGARVEEILPRGIGNDVLRLVDLALASSETQVLSCEVGDDPSTRWFDLRIVACGKNEALIIAQNVTARRLAEKKVLEQQLQVAGSARMAALGEMASGISHEINNPLGVILGMAQQLREHAEDGKLASPTVISMADRIVSTATRISRITHSLLAFARDGERDPIEVVPIGKILEDALEFCRRRFMSHSIRLHVGEIPKDVLVECRPVQIGQVILNLLNNAHDAVEALPEKWIRIELVDKSDRVEICVTDSGNGIAPELREKIFQPFFTTKKLGKGTGMGLSISSGIIAAHQGTIEMDEKHPRTRFRVTLPRKHKDPSA